MATSKRQEYLNKCMGTNYKLDHLLPFDDCETAESVMEATLKLVVDNFDIGKEGTDIEEIIFQACLECSKREWAS